MQRPGHKIRSIEGPRGSPIRSTQNMAVIRYTQHTGSTQDVPLSEGSNLMDLARANTVPGIDGDCGGSCACGTCHVIVDAAWAAKLAPPNSEEERLLSM
eukprot:gene12711-16187_t